MSNPPRVLRSTRAWLLATPPLVRALLPTTPPPLLVEGESTLMAGRGGTGGLPDSGVAGGPWASPMSLDLSVIDLSETVDNVEDLEVFANTEDNEGNTPGEDVLPLFPLPPRLLRDESSSDLSINPSQNFFSSSPYSGKL